MEDLDALSGVGRLPTRCFMHIPKSGGTSIHTALETALPADSLSPRRMDTSTLCSLHELPHLPAQTRDLIAVTDDEVLAMSRYRTVSGHFSLPTLLEITTASAIGTVLREPRARLLSLYLYWRTPGAFEAWRPYENDQYAAKPLDLFLAEPRVAPAVDNQLCRMLLYGDARLPSADFIAATDIAAIAAAAIARLRSLGFVGVLEHENNLWRDLSRLFGVSLAPQRLNVTGEEGDPLAAPRGEKLVTAATLELIRQRSAADQIVYSEALALAGVDPDERQHLADSAFASQLVLLGDLLGSSAARLPDGRRAIEQRDALYAQVSELRNHLDLTESAVRGLEDHNRETENAVRRLEGRLGPSASATSEQAEGDQHHGA